MSDIFIFLLTCFWLEINCLQIHRMPGRPLRGLARRKQRPRSQEFLSFDQSRLRYNPGNLTTTRKGKARQGVFPIFHSPHKMVIQVALREQSWTRKDLSCANSCRIFAQREIELNEGDSLRDKKSASVRTSFQYNTYNDVFAGGNLRKLSRQAVHLFYALDLKLQNRTNRGATFHNW